jgi:hypothetical protein
VINIIYRTLKEFKSLLTNFSFYLLSSLSLGGLDLPKRLILLVAKAIKQQFPTIHTNVTLSPIPNLRPWLMTTLLHTPNDIPWPTAHYEQLKRLSLLYPVSNIPAVTVETCSSRGGNTSGDNTGPPDIWLYHMLLNSSTSASSSSSSTSFSPYWFTHKPLFDALEGPLTWVACHYILNVKLPQTPSSIKPQYNSNNLKALGMQQEQYQQTPTLSSMVMRLPLDPVARFHLKNGASFHQVSDSSPCVYNVSIQYKLGKVVIT